MRVCAMSMQGMLHLLSWSYCISQRFSLVVDELSAVGLQSADLNGLADPYVQVAFFT